MSQTAFGDISKDILSGIAITVFIFTLSIYLPIIGFFCSFFIPLPILFYRSKLGRKMGGIIPAAAIIVMVGIAGQISVDIMFFVELGFLGFVLSELIEMDLTIERIILIASGAVLITGFAGLLFYSGISNTGIKTLVSNYVSKNLELTMALYKNMGMTEENIRIISDSLKNIQHALVRIIPALVVATTLFVSWTNLLMARPILRGKKLFYPDFGALNLWQPPENLVWGVIGCGGMLLLPNRVFKMFGLNGLIVLMVIYFFAGIAIVSYFFNKKKFPRLLRLILYSLIAMQQIILLIVIGVGLFDTWLDLRKIKLKKTQGMT